MTVRDLVDTSRVKVVFSGKASIATATTTTIGSDVNLAASSSYRPGDRIVVIFDASTAGTTDTTGFVVQDAPDSSGSIGTPATAVTSGSLAGGTGDQYAVVAVRLQPGRPWLRLRATRASGTTDTTVVQVMVLALPQAGI
jgi:hypothetical protein